MERKYWEQMAPTYDAEIFDVLRQDKQALILNALRQVADPQKTALDAGCAIGRWLPVLSQSFSSVTAVDISAKNLRLAAERNESLSNVTYQRADLSSAQSLFKGFDVVLCVNALLTDSTLKRDRFFTHLQKALRSGGQLILVVPALESWLLTRTIQHHYQVDKALFREKIGDRDAAARYRNMMQGNVEIDGVITKHFLGDELDLQLMRHGLEPLSRTRVEYDWHTEFVAPPAWLKNPRPFDWLVTATR